MTTTAPTRRTVLGERRFSPQDQRDFASASRDFNPMHVDAVAARRLLSGRQVVHGIHTLMHALQLCRFDGPPVPWKLACNFAHPVSVGDRVVFQQEDLEPGRTRLTATVDGLDCTEVLIEPLPAGGEARALSIGLPTRTIGTLAAPLDEPPGSQAGTLIELEGGDTALERTFPRAAAWLGRDGLAALAGLSFFVGMVCPGQHSVFSSLQLSRGTGGTAPLRFELRRYDPRFRLFTVAFDGALRGELRAFLRPPPQPQPGAAEVAAQLHGGEFAGTRSLVIGGSRGLGEITAKILAGGGGDVTVTYATGRGDADAVAADVNAQGRGRCTVAALDLGGPFAGAAGIDPATLDAVYFFATPRIYSKRSGLFDRGAFDEFVGFYLQRFHELCLWLESAGRSPPVKVYLPSTVFITDRPKGMTEYAMAKAAAEVLADDLNRSLRHVTVVHSRLPRLATDQTSSILKVEVASNLDAMLAVVRLMTG